MRHFVIDVEMLEKDYVLTLAQYLLSTVDVKCILTGISEAVLETSILL